MDRQRHVLCAAITPPFTNSIGLTASFVGRETWMRFLIASRNPRSSICLLRHVEIHQILLQEQLMVAIHVLIIEHLFCVCQSVDASSRLPPRLSEALGHFQDVLTPEFLDLIGNAARRLSISNASSYGQGCNLILFCYFHGAVIGFAWAVFARSGKFQAVNMVLSML